MIGSPSRRLSVPDLSQSHSPTVDRTVGAHEYEENSMLLGSGDEECKDAGADFGRAEIGPNPYIGPRIRNYLNRGRTRDQEAKADDNLDKDIAEESENRKRDAHGRGGE